MRIHKDLVGVSQKREALGDPMDILGLDGEYRAPILGYMEMISRITKKMQETYQSRNQTSHELLLSPGSGFSQQEPYRSLARSRDCADVIAVPPQESCEVNLK